MPGELRNATVSHSAGGLLISIQTLCEAKKPIPRKKSTTGIDVGGHFATLADGSQLAALNSFLRHENALHSLSLV
ncbi:MULTISPECIES: hypothetical protein [Paraburkholderia]|uniref:hypothetical protein n=1 Tax=Paraburkholderia TaxID=1822464 RepID=UPI00037D48F1|nr:MULTISPECIES: hypothetical protein [Paraburkholderia]MDH6147229.1 hypothetical protein [Paraburkholderia sp. WSM4179]